MEASGLFHLDSGVLDI